MNYEAPLEDPLQVFLNNGNFTLLAPQPPSSGAILAHILKILDGEELLPTNRVRSAVRVLTDFSKVFVLCRLPL